LHVVRRIKRWYVLRGRTLLAFDSCEEPIQPRSILWRHHRSRAEVRDLLT
jgi:hypothetical protein